MNPNFTDHSDHITMWAWVNLVRGSNWMSNPNKFAMMSHASILTKRQAKHSIVFCHTEHDLQWCTMMYMYVVHKPLAMAGNPIRAVVRKVAPHCAPTDEKQPLALRGSVYSVDVKAQGLRGVAKTWRGVIELGKTGKPQRRFQMPVRCPWGAHDRNAFIQNGPWDIMGPPGHRPPILWPSHNTRLPAEASVDTRRCLEVSTGVDGFWQLLTFCISVTFWHLQS